VVAVIDVPPRAPTPPVNVFDFLVQDATPKAAPAVGGAPERKMLERESSSMYVNHPNDSQYSQHSNGDGATYRQHGFSYGDAPVQQTFERYDSQSNMENSQASMMPPPSVYATPAPKKERRTRVRRATRSASAITSTTWTCPPPNALPRATRPWPTRPHLLLPQAESSTPASPVVSAAW